MCSTPSSTASRVGRSCSALIFASAASGSACFELAAPDLFGEVAEAALCRLHAGGASRRPERLVDVVQEVLVEAVRQGLLQGVVELALLRRLIPDRLLARLEILEEVQPVVDLEDPLLAGVTGVVAAVVADELRSATGFEQADDRGEVFGAVVEFGLETKERGFGSHGDAAWNIARDPKGGGGGRGMEGDRKTTREDSTGGVVSPPQSGPIGTQSAGRSAVVSGPDRYRN